MFSSQEAGGAVVQIASIGVYVCLLDCFALLSFKVDCPIDHVWPCVHFVVLYHHRFHLPADLRLVILLSTEYCK